MTQKKEQSNRRILNDSYYSGEQFKTKIKYGARLLYKKDPDAFYKDILLIKGEEIVFSKYSEYNCK